MGLLFTWDPKGCNFKRSLKLLDGIETCRLKDGFPALSERTQGNVNNGPCEAYSWNMAEHA